MKKILSVFIAILAIIALLLIANTSNAQSKPDTTKTLPVHYNELIRILLQLQRAEMVYHKLDIPALKRDTIDSYLGDINNFFNRRAQSVYADTAKKQVKK